MGRAKRPILTYDMAYAAAKDAGNRSMYQGRRTKWNYEDNQVALREFNRLWDEEHNCPRGNNGTRN